MAYMPWSALGSNSQVGRWSQVSLLSHNVLVISLNLKSSAHHVCHVMVCHGMLWLQVGCILVKLVVKKLKG